jgi:MoxR-like ATPase
LTVAAKANAFLKGRGYATPEDVKALAHDVMRHRLILSYEAEAMNISTDNVISQILSKVPVP